MHNPREKNGFTALRLLAALLVLLTHSTALLKGKQDFLGRHHLPQFSELAVDSFFVISGYLVCLALLKNPSIFCYIRNRCLRIFPGLVGVVLFTIFIVGPLFCTTPHYWTASHPFHYLWRALIFPTSPHTIDGVFSQNLVNVINGSLWTLPLEFICYTALLLLSFGRALNARMLFILLVMTLFIQQKSLISSVTDFFPYQVNRLGLFFISGSLLATLKGRLSFKPIFLFLAMVLAVLSFKGYQYIGWWCQPTLFMLLWPYIIISSAINLKKLHWLDRFDCSYGIYVYAFVVQQCLIATWGAQLTTTTLTIGAILFTVPLALGSWFLIERPFMALKNKKFSPALLPFLPVRIKTAQ